ncbi:MAG: STAS-like domain-containing protein [Mariprofundus sp.]
MKRINIAKDFSRYPAGRYSGDGPFCGEDFREKFLKKSMAANEQMVIELDGTRGYGSSFLEEAFGGLVRAGYTPEKINELITFEASDDSLIEEIKEYIEEAAEG